MSTMETVPFSSLQLINDVTTSLPPLPMFAVNPRVYEQFDFVVNMILTPILCVLGLVGNSVGLYVIGKDPSSKKHTIYTYMFSPMAFDILFLLLGLVTGALDILEHYDAYLGNKIKAYSWAYKGYCTVVLKHMGSILLIIMTLERWMSLVFPYHVKQSYLSRNPKTIVTVSFVVSAVYIIPFTAGVTVLETTDARNRTIYANGIDQNYFPVFYIYTYIETTVLHYLAPAFVLVFNILTVVSYSRFVKKRSSLGKRHMSDNQTKITFVVCCVAGLYILLSLPNIFVQTLIFINDDYSFYGRYNLTFDLFIQLGDFLARINAAADFFIYILVSNHFRSVFNSMLFKGDSESSRSRSSVSNEKQNVSTVNTKKSFDNIVGGKNNTINASTNSFHDI